MPCSKQYVNGFISETLQFVEEAGYADGEIDSGFGGFCVAGVNERLRALRTPYVVFANQQVQRPCGSDR